MIINDKQITMTASEWTMFKELTFAPWTPRTIDEFNAMCDLGRARHFHEKTDGSFIAGLACDCAKFDEDGTAHFPPDNRKLAYIKAFGKSPTPEQLVAFENGELQAGARPSLTVVKS